MSSKPKCRNKEWLISSGSWLADAPPSPYSNNVSTEEEVVSPMAQRHMEGQIPPLRVPKKSVYDGDASHSSRGIPGLDENAPMLLPMAFQPLRTRLISSSPESRLLMTAFADPETLVESNNHPLSRRDTTRTSQTYVQHDVSPASKDSGWDSSPPGKWYTPPAAPYPTPGSPYLGCLDSPLLWTRSPGFSRQTPERGCEEKPTDIPLADLPSPSTSPESYSSPSHQRTISDQLSLAYQNAIHEDGSRGLIVRSGTPQLAKAVSVESFAASAIKIEERPSAPPVPLIPKQVHKSVRHPCDDANSDSSSVAHRETLKERKSSIYGDEVGNEIYQTMSPPPRSSSLPTIHQKTVHNVQKELPLLPPCSRNPPEPHQSGILPAGKIMDTMAAVHSALFMKGAPLSGIAQQASTSSGPSSILLTIMGFLVYFNTQGLNQAFAIFQAYYMRTLLVTYSTLPLHTVLSPGSNTPTSIEIPVMTNPPHPSTVSLIGSTQIALLFICSPLTARLARRNFSHFALLVGSLLLVLATLITSWAFNWWHLFFAQGTLSGLAIGLIYGSGRELTSLLYPDPPTSASATISSGGAVGAIFYSVLLSQVIYPLTFGWTIRLIALLIFVSLLPCSLMFRRLLRARGLHPAPNQAAPPPVEKITFRKTYLYPPFILFTTSLFLAIWGICTPLYHLVTASLSVPHSWSAACALLIAFNAGTLPGRFASLIPATSFTSGTIATFASIGAGVALFIGITANYTGEVVVMAIYGVFVGVLQSLYGTLVGRACEGVEGRVNFVLVMSGLACFIGPPLGGLMIVGTGDKYVVLNAVAAAAIVLGGLGLFLGNWRGRVSTIVV